MKTPVILTAVGSASSPSASAYQAIHEGVQSLLTDVPLFMAFAPRTGHRDTPAASTSVPLSVLEQLASLAAQEARQAIIQPLQLLPGKEFHMLRRAFRQSPIPVHIGSPLLASPGDYYEFSEALAPLIEGRPDQAILLIGHGTHHPIWIAYHAIERFLRKRFGEHIWVGVIEKAPDSAALPGEIRAAGWDKVRIIPLLLTTGMHFQRDITGGSPESWRSRLEILGIEVECVEHGLGYLPGVISLFAGHIREALAESVAAGRREQR